MSQYLRRLISKHYRMCCSMTLTGPPNSFGHPLQFASSIAWHPVDQDLPDRHGRISALHFRRSECGHRDVLLMEGQVIHQQWMRAVEMFDTI
jgi:hypothetical protein